MISKSFIAFSFLAGFATPNALHAQQEKSVFVEALGASTSVGVHFDTRYNAHTHWGGRVGIAYTYSKSQDFFESAPERTRGWSFPVAVNYLIGQGRHRAEIGVGLSLGFYTCMYHDKLNREVEYDRTGAFGFFDLGYRYLSREGLMIRAGINPGIALGGQDESGSEDRGVDRAAVIYPYLSLGYTF